MGDVNASSIIGKPFFGEDLNQIDDRSEFRIC